MSDELILIVEDEAKLAGLLMQYLQRDGYRTHSLHNGADVLPWLQTHQPHLILLDLNLPSLDGLTICREIRRHSNIPVIMTTARVDELDRLIGLELGADDYICKPYSPREVVARVKAVLRRLQPPAHQESSLVLDAARQQARWQGQLLNLTRIEFELLALLAGQPGRIYSRDQLMDMIYPDHRVVHDRTIDSHIKKLRLKLKAAVPDQDIIQSVYGVGYKAELP